MSTTTTHFETTKMNFPRFLLPSLPLRKLVEASKRLEIASGLGGDDGDESEDDFLDAIAPRFSFDSEGGSVAIGRGGSSSSGSGGEEEEDDALSHSGESEYYTTDDDYNDFEGYEDEEEEEEDEEYYDDSGSEAAGSASTSGSVPVSVPQGVAIASGSAPSSYSSANDVDIGGRRRSSRGKRAAAIAAVNARVDEEKKAVEVVDVRLGIRRSNTERSQKGSAGGGCLAATVSTLKCHRCQTDLCFSSAIISKGFTGRHGRAYLVSSLLPSNILHSKPTSRTLQTGPHTVADISCTVCGSNLGWKYLAAEDRSQRYKVGKYILETGKVIRCNHWEKHGGMEEGKKDWKGWELGWEEGVISNGDEDDNAKKIEVDSEDEDEMEEFFSGTWDPDKVARRREKKRNRAVAV